MIRLTKHPTPKWLFSNGDLKTAEYLVAPPGNKPSPWRNAQIVAALKAECRNKCMYCEQFIDDSGYSAVEHIRPKAKFPNQVLSWENLGLVCSRCNSNKGDYHTETAELALINPYVDAVAEHIAFYGPLTVATPGSSRGRNTVRKLQLMLRTDLIFSRAVAIENLDSKLRLWIEEADDEKKQLFAEDVMADLSLDREHCGTLRQYAREFGFSLSS